MNEKAGIPYDGSLRLFEALDVSRVSGTFPDPVTGEELLIPRSSTTASDTGEFPLDVLADIVDLSGFTDDGASTTY